MSTFIFIHSTGGNPDECFYPWLRKELEKKGHKVYAPFFPTPLGQTQVGMRPTAHSAAAELRLTTG